MQRENELTEHSNEQNKNSNRIKHTFIGLNGERERRMFFTVKISLFFFNQLIIIILYEKAGISFRADWIGLSLSLFFLLKKQMKWRERERVGG